MQQSYAAICLISTRKVPWHGLDFRVTASLKSQWKRLDGLSLPAVFGLLPAAFVFGGTALGRLLDSPKQRRLNQRLFPRRAAWAVRHLNPTATTRRKSFLNAWARHAVCDGAQAWSTVSAWHGHRWLAMRLTRPVAVLSCPVVHDIAYIDAVYTSGRCPIMSGCARPDSVTQASRTGLSANWTRTSEQSSTATTKGPSHACSHENRSYRRRWAP